MDLDLMYATVGKLLEGRTYPLKWADMLDVLNAVNEMDMTEAAGELVGLTNIIRVMTINLEDPMFAPSIEFQWVMAYCQASGGSPETTFRVDKTVLYRHGIGVTTFPVFVAKAYSKKSGTFFAKIVNMIAYHREMRNGTERN